jgi:hypothetical protein
MSRLVINGSIDLSLIDKSKIIVGKKKRDDGSVGKYYNFALIETPDGKFGDFMIVAEQTKEEREKKQKSVILGNGKYSKKKEETSDTSSSESEAEGDDAPF